MKKILIILLTFCLFGCSNLGNTPTSKVEDLLNKYQMLDNDITIAINDVVDNDELTKEQQNRYRKLLEKQYKNLSYEVKNEEEDGNRATITTEIEVIDYKRAITKIESEYANKTNYTTEEFNEAKLKNLEETKEKVVYTIDFTVTKDENGNWSLDTLTNTDIKKIQGMY